MTPAEALSLSIAAAEGKRHKYYKHVVAYHEKCKALITAENLDVLLKRFTKREDDEMYEQRKAITRLTTRSVLHRISRPFAKALRNDEVRVEIEPKESAAVLEDFYDSQNLNTWMNEHYLSVLFTDPNAWLLVDFEPFDPNTETANPYPLLLMSDQVYDFGHDYQGLHYLTAQIDNKFATFIDNYAALLTEVPKESVKGMTVKKLREFRKDLAAEMLQAEINGQNLDTYFPQEGVLVEVGSSVCRVGYADHIAGQVPAMRIGYEADTMTNGMTVVAPYHACITRLEGGIKSMSERDLTTALHVFPMKFIRTVECNGYQEGGAHYDCLDGKVLIEDEYHTCKKCGGKGQVPIHTSAQDVISVPLGESKEDSWPLEEMVKYLTPDLEVAKYLTDSIERVEDACFHDVFPGNAYSTRMREITATEARNDYDAIYDTLYPFTKHYSRLFKFAARVVATYTDTEFERIEHQFPSDLKLKGMGDLVREYKEASDAGAPPQVLKGIQEQIIHKQYVDDVAMRNKLIRRMSFDPLAGYTDQKITLAAMDISDRDRFIHYNIERIWMELEQENPDIYEFEESRARQLFAAKVDEIRPRDQPVIDIEQ